LVWGIAGRACAPTGGVLLDTSHAPTGKEPYIQRHHLGAVFAVLFI
jgi:hypothetical protein